MNEQNHDKEFIEHYEKLLERVDKENERVYKYYRLAALLLTALILAYSYFYFTNIKEMKDSAGNEVNQLKESVNKKVNFLTDSISYDLKNTVYKVEKDVKTKIEEEFDKENITNLVNNTARERIDLVADQLVKKQIDERIIPELNSSKEKIDNLVGSTNKNILELEFKLTKVAALNDDRGSFDKLVRWSNDKNYIFANEAEELKNQIISMYSKIGDLTLLGWAENLNKLNLNEIWSLYNNSIRDNKAYIINELWSKNLLTEKERLELSIDIIKNDSSILCVVIAAGHLIQKYKINSKPLEIENVINWWNEYKH